MKLSYLLKKGIDHLIEHGDCDIRVNLLTENQCNFLNDLTMSIVDYDNIFELEIDIINKRSLMKKIK